MNQPNSTACRQGSHRGAGKETNSETTDATVSPYATPQRRHDVLVEELDDEAVLHDPRSGAIHYFNTTVLGIWKACDGTRTSRDIARGLASRHSLDVEEALESVRGVVGVLSEQGLLLGLAPNGESPLTCDRHNQGHPLGVTRREVLGDGAGKLVYVAPVVSTFFATGAFASGPSASGAFGEGGCKTVGYSCAVDEDCCSDDCDGGQCASP